MEIRAMCSADYDRVFQLWMSCKNMGFNDLDDSKQGIATFLDRNPNTSFVALEHDAVIGVVMAGHDGRRGYIYHLAVDDAHRRQGVGAKLVETCVAALRKEGIHKAALLVFGKNETGNAFWEKQGFAVRRDILYRNRELTKMIRIDT